MIFLTDVQGQAQVLNNEYYFVSLSIFAAGSSSRATKESRDDRCRLFETYSGTENGVEKEEDERETKSEEEGTQRKETNREGRKCRN